jgi:hypothetical protein
MHTSDLTWRRRFFAVVGLGLVATPMAVMAGSIPGGSLNTFVNGTATDADLVNANFAAVETAVNGNAADVGANAAAIGTNDGGVAANAAALAASRTAEKIADFGSTTDLVDGGTVCDQATFDAPTDGTYALHGRWNVISNDTANCRYVRCSIDVDGTPVGVVGDLNDGLIHLGAEYNDQYGTGYQFGLVPMTAGTHTLQWTCGSENCGSVSMQCFRSQVVVHGPF